MNFFDFKDDESSSSQVLHMSRGIWIYFVITILLTTGTIILKMHWDSVSSGMRKLLSFAFLKRREGKEEALDLPQNVEVLEGYKTPETIALQLLSLNLQSLA